eukprot:scpid84161/ scgid2836/ 
MCADIHGAVRCAARPPVPSSRRQRRAWSTCVILACFVLCLHSPCVQVDAETCTVASPQNGTWSVVNNGIAAAAGGGSVETKNITANITVATIVSFSCNAGFALHGYMQYVCDPSTSALKPIGDFQNAMMYTLLASLSSSGTSPTSATAIIPTSLTTTLPTSAPTMMPTSLN